MKNSLMLLRLTNRTVASSGPGWEGLWQASPGRRWRIFVNSPCEQKINFKHPRTLGDEFLWWFCSWCAPQNFLWQVPLFLEYFNWRVKQIHPNCFRRACWWCQNLCCSEFLSQKETNLNLTISGTPNLSTRFLTFTGNASNFLYFGSKIRFQLHSISRQRFSLNTYDDAFRGGDLHICERSCALDVQTELHFWGIDDLHLEVVVLASSDLLRNSYS